MRRLLIFCILLYQSSADIVASDQVDYVSDIKPILKERCFACHGALKQEGELRLDTVALMSKGGDSGPALVANAPDASLLVERVSAADEAERMPPEGHPLTAEQIQLLATWIRQGATGPSDEEPEQDPRHHWSFQKLVRPSVPDVSPDHSVHNPIDAFLAAHHDKHSFSALPVASKHVRLRRLYLDLIGLPPTRDELHDFIQDDSPDAYDSVVTKLLNKSQYGERWARHWMDVWRYSDWYGRRHVPDVWNSAPQVWRWRDWIVNSLNGDHGYDRMIQEMLAADEICPEDTEAGYATGYLVRNWYALNPNDWMRSTVEHTGKAFLGLTFNCAHCHDHKYDPIQQDDYFRLRAFFEPIYIRQDRVPGEADPGPFQDYDYGKLRKIQQVGAVRIFDKNPDAITWFYSAGDERNRDKERGTVPPGVPQFLAESLPEIATVELPPRAWYPGLNPDIQQTVLAEANAAVASAEEVYVAAQKSSAEPSQSPRDQLVAAEAAYEIAKAQALNEEAGALAGQQSLYFDATIGRRIVHNRLPGLRELVDGVTVDFQLFISSDSHFNFQFAKDVVKGLTAGYVAFEKGKIIAYRPGSFSTFESGTYDFVAGQNHFHIQLSLQTEADRCLLTVRSLSDGQLLVDAVPVALNGWNPVGDPTKAITFDARTGSIAAIDEVVMTFPANSAGSSPERVAAFDFEPPLYADGCDVIGISSWEESPLSVAPAVSVVSTATVNNTVRQRLKNVEAARRAVEAVTLPERAAAAAKQAATAELKSVEARIAADRAKYGESPQADAESLAATAGQLQREAAARAAEADVLARQQDLAAAEALPADNADRSKKTAEATKALTAAQDALKKAKTALADNSQAAPYTAFSPVYPRTSTGRRRALAEWMTSRSNPLTARVAINHIWMRHFHAPLVASVNDFGRNGDLPTHPKLLDWLAVELMESNWSMKHIHRLIVSSAAFQRVSAGEGSAHWNKLDPENRLLWRMNTGRMEAEVIRDSLLYCGGQLDATMGGQPLENTESLTTNRRSLYYSVYPEQGGQSPLGELFDGPDALDCYRRTRTVVPQQALAMTNSELVHKMSAAVVEARDVEGGSEEDIITQAFEQILSRAPSVTELRTCVEVFDQQRELLTRQGNDRVTARRNAYQSVVRALFNHNDFVTIR